MTFTEFLGAAERHLRRPRYDSPSIWSGLVQSAQRLHGDGCDGMLLGEAVDYAISLLSQMNDEGIFEIWKETENGLMAIEQGDHEFIREQMILDIDVQLHESICDRVCSEMHEARMA